MSRYATLLWAIFWTAAGGAGGQDPAAWPTYPVSGAPAALRPIVQHADLIVISLQSAVLKELRREMDRGGPVAALDSCHIDAAGAAYGAAREKGVAAGRTSDRLRNPANAPRPWAAPIVARYAGRSAADVDGFVVDLGDRIGVLRPIAHQSMCGACHGPEDGISPEVRAKLRQRYPRDRAVGFGEGDLRGWFWVEVPKS